MLCRSVNEYTFNALRQSSHRKLSQKGLERESYVSSQALRGEEVGLASEKVQLWKAAMHKIVYIHRKERALNRVPTGDPMSDLCISPDLHTSD